MATRNARLITPLGAVERRGHPWIYSTAIELPEGLRPGDIVDVLARSGRFVGRGIADPGSAIAVRIWTRDPDEEIDDALFVRLIKRAWATRMALLRGQSTDAFRLLHGEADGTPGIVCDVYERYAVLQADGPAAERLLPEVGRAIATALPHLPNVVVKARDRGGRSGGGSQGLHAVVGALPEDAVTVHEHGMRFLIDIERGQKTGAYLDQRENRRLVRESAADLDVLNLFCYTGGFSLAAMLGGAASVTSVDIAEPAIEAARANMLLNGFSADDPRIAFETSDVHDFLGRDRRRYGMVILDPPALAHSSKQIPRALEAYRRLNTAALARVAPGGLLISASCTRRITESMLEGIIADAGRDAGRDVRVIRRTGASPDHPVIRAFPEGDYLTMIWAQIGP